MSYWNAGRRPLDALDCLLIFGGNPALSMTFQNLFADLTKRLKAALKRGMTNLLTRTDRHVETINAMPRMSAIPFA